MQARDVVDFLDNVGKDPARLAFEDELTGIHNRRFLLGYLDRKVDWDSGAELPLSMLVVDLDRFKEVNDVHGHQTGDQVLTWIAAILREVVADTGLAIRFGGDEFVLLLPQTDRSAAYDVARRLVEATRERPFRQRDKGVVVPVTFSVGIATAPADADDQQALFRAADTALYHAKRSGRNRIATAGEIELETVFPRTALHRLKATGITGRDSELAIVSEALEELTAGTSGFLLFESAPGMGKTAFLRTVRNNLSDDDDICAVMISGDVREGYRPYYLASRILVNLMKEREDRGVDLLQDLTRDEVRYLSCIVPQFADEEMPATEEDGVTMREGIFNAFAQVLPVAADSRPLLLLIDDLHFADEATLRLLNVLVAREEVPVLVCSAGLENLHPVGKEEATPLEELLRRDRFARIHKLEPLDAEAIHEHLQTIFPDARIPSGLVGELEQITQGSPLFVVEIIRQLVTDQKVRLADGRWTIEPLEDGYLPRSLEDIILSKIVAFDEESRQMLEEATAIGEEVSLSVFTGASQFDEAEVLDFLDRAEALGLVRLDFQLNDEIMSFLGKQVLEISYGAIDERRRQQLHEKIGAYHENLYEQRVLLSASLLAFHFKRSANRDKARSYEQMHAAHSREVFNAHEAVAYTGEPFDDEADGPIEPLGEEALAHVPDVLRSLVTAARTLQLYPPESKVIVGSLSSTRDAIDRVLRSNERLSLSHRRGTLLVNGEEAELGDAVFLAETFTDILDRVTLEGVTFRRGVTEEEIRRLLTSMGEVQPGAIGRGYWKDLAEEHGLENVDLRQMRYAQIRERRQAAIAEAGDDEELSAEDLSAIPDLLRESLKAAKSARLYPPESDVVQTTIQRLHRALQEILERHSSITFAGVDGSLLVNGTRVGGAEIDTVASSFLELVSVMGIDSITFFAGIPESEVAALVLRLRERPDSADSDSWEKLAQNEGFTSIAFNQRRYALGVVGSLLSAVTRSETLPAGRGVGASAPAPGGAAVAETLEMGPVESEERYHHGEFRGALRKFGKELLLKGEQRMFRQLVEQLFEEYADRDPGDRAETVETCLQVFDSLVLALQHSFASLSEEELLEALAAEGEAGPLEPLANLLFRMSGSVVQFGDYDMATRILLGLKKRREELHDEGQGRFDALLEGSLDSTTQQLIEADLKSGELSRQEKACRVLGSLGSAGIEMLVEVIKQEKDLRVRQMAASLLAEMGPEAVHLIKRALVTEVIVEQRFNILEVIDTITNDLRDELMYCLGDVNAKIRRGAFRLFERLGDDALIDVIIPFAKDEDPAVVKGTIRSLANLGSPTAVGAIMSILDGTVEPELAIACCQALGQIGDVAGIEALANVLGRRKLTILGRQWGEQVRAAAAMAVRQIADPRAAEVLSRFASDSSPLVRQLARSAS